VSLERGPLSLMSTVEELLGKKSTCSGLENRDYDRRDPSRWPCGTLCSPKLAPTSSTSGGRSIGILLSITKATESLISVIISYRRRDSDIYVLSETKVHRDRVSMICVHRVEIFPLLTQRDTEK
jgi:hypothetical protein